MMDQKWIAILLVSLIALSGCIVESSHCNMLNIDSFEVSTGIDIPRVSEVQCFENDSIRTSFFYLNVENSSFLKSYQTITGYRDRFEMTPENLDNSISFFAPEIIPAELQSPPETVAYTRNGQTESGRKWQVTLFENSNLLIAEMETK